MTVRIYLRVSREDESDILRNQRQRALDYAETRFGQALVYQDVISGGEPQERRRGLGALMRDVRHGDVVIFTAPSRMTRGGLGAAIHILYQLEQAGASWHFTEYPILNFDETTHPLVKGVLMAILTEYDADYRRRISERTKAALRLAKSQGRNVGGARRGAGRPRKNQGSPLEAFIPEPVEFKVPLNSDSIIR